MTLVTSPAIDTRPHTAALLAALNAALSPNAAYTFDEVPGTRDTGTEGADELELPGIYAAVAVERRYVPPLRADGSAGRSGWRAIVRFVGRDVLEAQWCEYRVAGALDRVRLTVAGAKTSPLTHEQTTSPEQDDQRWSGLSQWTYAR